MAIHNAKCPQFNTDVYVSSDGVSECKSNTNTLDVYSIRFSNCRTIYPLKLIRPIGKYRIDVQKYLDDFLTDVCGNNCIILAFIGDNPKRAIARLAKMHSGYYACEYCEAKGLLLHLHDTALKFRKTQLLKQKEQIKNQIEGLNDPEQIESLKKLDKTLDETIKSLSKKNNKIVWPASTQNACKRSRERVEEIVNKFENDDILSLDEAKGIMGRSLFLEIPYFDFVLHIPAEYLHGVCLGTVRKLIELTFNVGENRIRITNRKLSSAADFNKLMSLIQVVREFSRRARNLDFSVMKGQEYRNIIIVFFPLVIDCIEPNAKERKLWLLMAFMVRLCILPNEEYECNNQDLIKYCGSQFYTIFEKLFGSRNCSYYVHIVSTHMSDVRVNGPVTETSAFGFESFYGEMRHAFSPGTLSPLKQIMENILLKRSIAPHSCQSPIFYSHKETPLECNSLIYTFSNKHYNLFKITEIDGEHFTCNKVGKYTTSFPETPTLKWENIGGFKAGGISDEIEIVNKCDVAGKFIRVSDLFITVPKNVLQEK